MLRSLDSISEAFMTSMDQINQRMQRAQQQISTGLRVSSVADEPDSVSTLLQVRADLSSTEQIQSNLGRVKTETDSAEQALQSAVSLVERTRVIGSEALSATGTSQTRATLATQVGSILEQLGGLANTAVEGRYIFSGDADQTPPYTVDLSAKPPVSVYKGSPANRQIQHPNGTRFSVTKTAQDIFDSPDPTQSVFASLQSLKSSLEANDTAGISSAGGNVKSSLDYLNGQLAYYGTVQNKVADATTYGNSYKLQLQTRLSSLQDADLTSAIVELNQAQLQQSAALQAQARIPRTSLFDFLK